MVMQGAFSFTIVDLSTFNQIAARIARYVSLGLLGLLAYCWVAAFVLNLAYHLFTVAVSRALQMDVFTQALLVIILGFLLYKAFMFTAPLVRSALHR